MTITQGTYLAHFYYYALLKQRDKISLLAPVPIVLFLLAEF